MKERLPALERSSGKGISNQEKRGIRGKKFIKSSQGLRGMTTGMGRERGREDGNLASDFNLLINLK